MLLNSFVWILYFHAKKHIPDSVYEVADRVADTLHTVFPSLFIGNARLIWILHQGPFWQKSINFFWNLETDSARF